MGPRPTEVPFRRHDPGPVQAAIERLTGSEGWVNLFALVDERDVPPRSIFGELFTARGPDVPLATWTASPPTIGIRHGSGTRAKQRLADLGHPVPSGWRVVQDHPRRGLAISLPADAGSGEVARWLVDGAALLSTVPTGDQWMALVYER